MPIQAIVWILACATWPAIRLYVHLITLKELAAQPAEKAACLRGIKREHGLNVVVMVFAVACAIQQIRIDRTWPLAYLLLAASIAVSGIISIWYHRSLLRLPDQAEPAGDG